MDGSLNDWDTRTRMCELNKVGLDFAEMRTFLVALDRKTVDCREAKGANWAGRSPLLGSIAMCRPAPLIITVGFRKVVCTGPIW
jgi:hypothetical protein